MKVGAPGSVTGAPRVHTTLKAVRIWWGKYRFLDERVGGCAARCAYGSAMDCAALSSVRTCMTKLCEQTRSGHGGYKNSVRKIGAEVAEKRTLLADPVQKFGGKKTLLTKPFRNAEAALHALKFWRHTHRVRH